MLIFIALYDCIKYSIDYIQFNVYVAYTCLLFCNFCLIGLSVAVHLNVVENVALTVSPVCLSVCLSVCLPVPCLCLTQEHTFADSSDVVLISRFLL